MNDWIKWKDQAPTDADLPIEIANYGWPIGSYRDRLNMYSMNPDLWRRHICDIPKVQIQPDANGWWKIEDRKPEDNQTIKFKIKNVSFIHIGYYQREGIFISLNNSNESDELDVQAWCPLDMTGPEER